MTNTLNIKEIEVLYFASLAEKLDKTGETISFHGDNVHQLKTFLANRSHQFEALLEPTILCAINHTIAAENTSVAHGDEVAFFPPVTGG